MSVYLKQFSTHAEYDTYINGSGAILPNVSICEDTKDVHYNPYVDPYAGHEYVDLGLPSGTKWATMNVGASSETDYGLFFQWGDTQGYIADQVGSGEGQKYFGWTDYKFNPSGDASTFTKYNNSDGKTVLDAEDDAVQAAWGGSWEMPTKEQFEELLNSSYCTNVWTSITVGGTTAYGRLFTSKSNGNTLFFPAVGWCVNGSVRNVDEIGIYLSSSLGFSDKAFCSSLRLGSSSIYPYGTRRSDGNSVRGVVA